MGASTIAIRPLQDFQAKVEGGRLFDMGGSTVNYGTCTINFDQSTKVFNNISLCGLPHNGNF